MKPAQCTKLIISDVLCVTQTNKFCWGYGHENASRKGFEIFVSRNLNQDPVENFFGQIRQHGILCMVCGICNTNPTCYQFVAALKTIVNNFGSQISKHQNCEEDYCKSLEDLRKFLQNFTEEEVIIESEHENQFDIIDDFENSMNQGTAYVAGYILKKINFPDIFLQPHLYAMFKEYDGENRLKYTSQKVINFVKNIYINLSNYLEIKFKNKFAETFNSFEFCPNHNCLKMYSIGL